MLKVDILSSGSHGNSAVISNGDTTLCIDFGVTSYRKWDELAKAQGISIDDLDAVLITHAHGDHIASLNTFIRYRDNSLIYTPSGVLEDLKTLKKKTEKKKTGKQMTRLDPEKVNILDVNKVNRVGSFMITPRHMKHDGHGPSRISECVGFEIYDEVNDKRYLYATDTGTLRNVVVPRKGFDLVMVESNHEREYVDYIYSVLPDTAANYVRRQRTIKDHLSVEALQEWLMNNGISCPVIELHESRAMKPRGVFADLNKYNQTFFQDEDEKEGKHE